jgi:hypothetical protein
MTCARCHKEPGVMYAATVNGVNLYVCTKCWPLVVMGRLF